MKEEIILRHVKTGGLYKVLGPATIEATGANVVVYRSLQDGRVWIRPTVEMVDGRFALEDAATQNTGD